MEADEEGGISDIEEGIEGTKERHKRR